MMSNLSGSRITVTGGLGFIGSNLTITLVNRGADVTVIDLPQSKDGPDATAIEPVCPSVDIVRADIRDSDTIEPHVASADIVYHLAAKTSRPGSIETPSVDTETNCLGTLNVLETAADTSSPPRVVFASSQTAVGDRDESTFDGRAQTQGTLIDIYGANKRAGEGYCMAFHRSRDVPTVVTRLSNVYGPRGRLDTTVVDTFVRAALRDEPLSVFEPGTQKRDLIFVDDVVDALVRLGQNDNVVGDRFALGTGRSRTILEVAETIVAVANSGSVKMASWPPSWEPLELGDLEADPTRLKAVTDWTPTTDFERGVERMIEYYRRAPSRYEDE